MGEKSKMKYEKPKLISLNSDIGPAKGSNSCKNGSGEADNCIAGNSAGHLCQVGNSASTVCSHGNGN